MTDVQHITLIKHIPDQPNQYAYRIIRERQKLEQTLTQMKIIQIPLNHSTEII
jgi:hypothetical protein